MINRVKEIKRKGFVMKPEEEYQAFSADDGFVPVDFSKIKVGVKTLNDAVLDLNAYKKLNDRLGDKQTILDAMYSGDYDTMREASEFFFKISGIYRRLCVYMAYLYNYDWMVTPYVGSGKITPEKLTEGFDKVLYYLDNSDIKDLFGDIALKVVKCGCYYGYLIKKSDQFTIQELPPRYCRSRFKVGNKPAIEFNMKYFDVAFRDANQRMRVLKMFPEEFQKGYVLYKQGKLLPDFQGDTNGWYLLDVGNTIKFNINEDDSPMMISVIPAIIDLEEAKGLDRKKMAQKLLKILIQKMPIDKNGDLVFDVDEAKALHNNAVSMLKKAIGVDVLTTFADVTVEDMADDSKTTATDDLERVERSVFNEGGVSQMQFNTDGNIALEKSILNDEASMYNLITQFEKFLNYAIKQFNTSPKKVRYQVQILKTTIYNYKEMSKLYKEQMQLGYSKMLAQIALGQSQSSILANAYFENDILDLVNVFIPPLMSSTMNAEAIQNRGGRNSNGGGQAAPSGETKSAGRPEKSDDEKSTKTIQNKESAN